MSCRQTRWLLLALFAITAVFQIAIAGRQCLWADEIFSLAIATGHSLEHPAKVARAEQGDFVEPTTAVPAVEFRRYLQHESPPAGPGRVIRAVLLSDTNPPLYYLLLYGWTLVFGTSDVTIRLFSVACSLACFPLLVGIAQRIGGRRAIIPACFLFALSPLGIYYSTEARMYSLLWLCVLATTWASLVLYQRGRGIGRCAFWVTASAAGLLTHYFFAFPWLAVVVCLAINPGKLKRWHLVACTLAVAALILPLYSNLPASLGGWRVTKDWLNWRPWHFNRMADMFQLVAQFFDGHAKYLWPSHRMSSVAALMLFGIIAVVIVWRLRLRLFHPRLALVWLPFAAACAGPAVFDLLRHTYTVAVPRYAIAALPGACLLAALGLACLKSRTRMFMLLLIASAWAPNALSICRLRARTFEPFREVAKAVSDGDTASDLILVHSIPSGVIGIARYANGPAMTASWVGQLKNRQVPEAVNTLAAGRKRVFFVKIHEVGEPAPEEDWLRANAVVFRETRIKAANIIEFRPNKTETF
jgi:dolichyl-phosphate-mannose-protein mannosyltransferase